MGLVGRRAVLPLAFCLAALAWPAAAMAAQGSLSGTTMNYTADASETNNAVVTLVTQGGSPYYSVHDPGAVITAQTPCLDQSNGAPDQNTMICPQNLVESLSASLGDGNDKITVLANL